MTTFSVSEITEKIKSSILDEFPDKICVSGETTNVKKSGDHMYFTLKDEDASLSCMFFGYFRTNKTVLNSGEKIVASGKLSLYVKNGTYSLNIVRIDKIGVGLLHQKYEELKEYFRTKKYYENKLELPKIIKNIGIITSPEGAVLQDILFVLNKNNFNGNIFIKRCNVQGVQCPKSVINAIDYFLLNDHKLDLLLIARGGGSFEDLIGYSDEDLVEKIYEIKKHGICTISAVGHEVDFMLSDFVCDIRAPTPSIGAEIICQQYNLQNDVVETYKNMMHNIHNIIMSKIQNMNHKLVILKEQLKSPHELKLKQFEIDDLNMCKFENSFCCEINNRITDLKHEFILEKTKIETKIDVKTDTHPEYELYFLNSKNKYVKCKTAKRLKRYIDSCDELPVKLVFSDGFVLGTLKSE